MKTIIIDTSYLMFRSYFAYPHLTSKNQPTGAFFGFAKCTLALLEEFRPDRIVFAQDTKEPTWRHNALTDYKAGRPPLEENMVVQIPLILDWCSSITENFFTYPGYEADDIINTVSTDLLLNNYEEELKEDGLFSDNQPQEFEIYNLEKRKLLETPKEEVYIFSADRDLYQLFVFDNLYFIRNRDNKSGFELFSREHFKQKYELEPNQWLDYKALTGDASDNLKGIDGIGPKTATKILQNVGSLFNIATILGFDNKPFIRGSFNTPHITLEIAKQFVNDPKNAKLFEKIKANSTLLAQTYHLATLSNLSIQKEITPNLDLKKGLSMFEQFGFSSLVKTATKSYEEIQETEALF